MGVGGSTTITRRTGSRSGDDSRVSTSSRGNEEAVGAPYTMSQSQVARMQRLFSHGLRPDTTLLPFQMPRMRRDVPPRARQQRKTVKVKNICSLSKEDVALDKLEGGERYRLRFRYSARVRCFVTVYYFCNERTDSAQCSLAFSERFRRPIFDFVADQKKKRLKEQSVFEDDDIKSREIDDSTSTIPKSISHSSPSATGAEQSGLLSSDSRTEVISSSLTSSSAIRADRSTYSPAMGSSKEMSSRPYVLTDEEAEYSGTSYELRPAMNETFKQSYRDCVDFSGIPPTFYQSTPSLGFHPIVIVISREIPESSLLCSISKKKRKDVDIKSDDQSKTDGKTSKSREELADLWDEASEAQIRQRDALEDEESAAVAAAAAAHVDRDSLSTAMDDSRLISDTGLDSPRLRKPMEWVDKVVYYCKLSLQSDGSYTCNVTAQKSEWKGRAYQTQDIYGLDCASDPYTGDDNSCVICMMEPRNTVLLPCRHLCMCDGCAAELLRRSNRCPVCRAYCGESFRISLPVTEEHRGQEQEEAEDLRRGL